MGWLRHWTSQPRTVIVHHLLSCHSVRKSNWIKVKGVLFRCELSPWHFSPPLLSSQWSPRHGNICIIQHHSASILDVSLDRHFLSSTHTTAGILRDAITESVFYKVSHTNLTFHHNSISYHKYIITGGVASQKSFWGTKMFDLGEQQYFVWDAASQSTKWLNILKMGPWRPGYAYDHNHDNFYDFGISWAQHLRRHYSNFTSQHLSRSTTYHHITSFSTNKSLTKRNMPCKKHFVAIARLPPQFRLHLCVVCFVRT